MPPTRDNAGPGTGLGGDGPPRKETAMSYSKVLNARRLAGRSTATPQSAPIPGRETAMVRNRAGGFVFAVDHWGRLSRFLILGSDAPTFYADAREMTLSNVEGVLACLRDDGQRVVREVVDVSRGGRAPKNDPALYVLALACAYGVDRGRTPQQGEASRADALAAALTSAADPRAEAVRRAAFDALPLVARTGTHLLQFFAMMESLRGWGRQPVRAARAWLDRLDDERLSLQAVKYRQRGGWEFRDLLRLAHPSGEGLSPARRALVDWIAHRKLDAEEIAGHEARVEEGAVFSFQTNRTARRATPRRHAVRPGVEVIAAARPLHRLVDGFHLAQEASSAAEAARVVRSHSIPWECVRKEHLNDVRVWDALLEDMPLGAMLRNLNKMTSVGLIGRGSAAARHVAERLQDEEALRRARVHPFRMLVTLRVYGQGRGVVGDLVWSPVPEVVDALDSGFYRSFRAVRPTGLRRLEALDLSGSMNTSMLVGGRDRLGNPVRGPVSARVASAALAMVTAATEDNVHMVGFSGTLGAGYSNRQRGIPAGSWRSTNGPNRFSGEDALIELDLSPRRRLDDAVRYIDEQPMGGTDAALPILYALDRGLEVDVFTIYTDSETWSGRTHPAEALTRYRKETGIDAKLVAVAMTATEYSVADPSDTRCLNVVGFDAAAPAVIADFVIGGRSVGSGTQEVEAE